jgi:chemotaxis protein methyltransferase CheR
MSLTTLHFDYVSKLARDVAAIVLERGKEYLVVLRLTPLAQANGFPNLSAFIEHLRTRPMEQAHHQVVDALTTNETMFFRDGAPFEAMRQVLLPALLTKAATTRQLRIWSAACSTGQEPYSLAMLLLESAPQLRDWDVRILATDLCVNTLALATAGTFTPFEIARGLSEPLRNKYFTRQTDQWTVKEPLRRMIEFRRMNLSQPWPDLPTFDLIFIRNVMIYFDVPTKQSILRRARARLQPHGHLFLGSAETTVNLDPNWRPVSCGGSVVYAPC